MALSSRLILALLLLLAAHGEVHGAVRSAKRATGKLAAPAKLAKRAAAAKTVGLNPYGVREFGYTATFSDGQTAGGGSCGYGTAEESGYGINTLSASTAVYRNGLNCGACYQLQCSGSTLCLPGKTPILTVTNICPQGGPGGWCDGQKKSYSLAPEVWNGIGRDPNLAVVPVSVERVACPRVGGITFKVVQGNAFYFSAWWAVVISNVAGSGDILSVWVQFTGSYWQKMTHSFGAVWGISQVQPTAGSPGAFFSFKITTGYRREELLIPNAIPATYLPNMAYPSTLNFRSPVPPVPARGRRAMEGEVFNATMLVPKDSLV